MIRTFQEVSQMLVEIAPRLDVAEVSASEASQGWAVAFDAGGLEVVTLDYDLPNRKLLMSAELGAPPEEGRFATYAGLLQYNRFWSETDGVRTALDGPDGPAVMFFDIALDHLDAAKLETALGNVARLARSLRSLVAIGWEAETAALEASPETQAVIVRG